MTTRSPRTILTFSAALALTVAALAPAATLARGPNGGGGDATCDGDCTADAPQALQVRARDGSGVNQSTGTQANAGGGGQVRAGAEDATKTQTWNTNRGRNANANDNDQNAIADGNRGNANANGQNAKSGAGQGPNEDGQRGPGTCDDCDVQMGTLTLDQEQGLIFMAEEEKLAHDVYAALAEQYDVPIFSNIANSEARHQAAVGVVLERYGIDASSLPVAAGDFDNELLGSLYTSLLEEGSASYEAALGVGVQIEELDIADLESRLENLQDAPDVYEMYSHLLAGSQNHLAAFEGRL